MKIYKYTIESIGRIAYNENNGIDGTVLIRVWEDEE